MTTPSNTAIKNLDLAAFNAHMAPELDRFIKEHQTALQGKDINKTQALQDMYAFVHGKFPVRWIPGPAGRRAKPAAAVSVSPACITAITTCCIDVLSIVLQAAGVPESITRAAATEVIEEVGPEALTLLERQVVALEQASSMTDKAKAIFALFAAIYKITGLRQIMGAIEHHMKWYEWVIMGTVISAQIVAWVASDGVAAVAEIVILAALVGQAVADAGMAVSDCGWS
jgi:hypothetical protein